MPVREVGDAMLRQLLSTVVDAVPGALGAGVALAGGESPRLVAAVGLAVDLDRAQWERRHGPVWEPLRTGRALVAPGEAGIAVPPAARGLIALPGEWDGEATLVVTLYLDRPALEDDLARVDRVQPMLASAVAVVEYCAGEEQRAEQMVQMVQYRRVIEQAKGIIIAVTGADAQAAFATLARASQHFNVRLRNLAIALVELVGGAPAEGPTDPTQVVTPTDQDRRSAARVWAALRSSGPGPSTGGAGAGGPPPGPSSGGRE